MTTTNQNPAFTDNQEDGFLDDNTTQGDQVNPKENADISQSELDLLDKAGTPEDDHTGDEPLLDETDEEGDELNEADDLTGGDLDVPGSDSDDDEASGEEDEENNSYSQADQEDGEDDSTV